MRIHLYLILWDVQALHLLLSRKAAPQGSSTLYPSVRLTPAVPEPPGAPAVRLTPAVPKPTSSTAEWLAPAERTTPRGTPVPIQPSQAIAPPPVPLPPNLPPPPAPLPLPTTPHPEDLPERDFRGPLPGWVERQRAGGGRDPAWDPGWGSMTAEVLPHERGSGASDYYYWPKGRDSVNILGQSLYLAHRSEIFQKETSFRTRSPQQEQLKPVYRKSAGAVKIVP